MSEWFEFPLRPEWVTPAEGWTFDPDALDERPPLELPLPISRVTRVTIDVVVPFDDETLTAEPVTPAAVEGGLDASQKRTS